MYNEQREILEGLKRKLESGTCTALEVHNIKMYAMLLRDKDVLKRIAEREIKEQNGSTNT